MPQPRAMAGAAPPPVAFAMPSLGVAALPTSAAAVAHLTPEGKAWMVASEARSSCRHASSGATCTSASAAALCAATLTVVGKRRPSTLRPLPHPGKNLVIVAANEEGSAASSAESKGQQQPPPPPSSQQQQQQQQPPEPQQSLPATPVADPARMALAVQRLTGAAGSLRRWGYVAEVTYTWLGLISLGVACFAGYARGGLTAYRNPSMALGLASVGMSLMCALIGWFQARTCRGLGRRCAQAAKTLEPGGAMPQSMQFVPTLGEVEGGLRARQRTAWMGAFSAVFGLQAMVGLLVTKVLVASGTVSPAPGVSLDVFTLLAVSNSALSHVIGGGAAALQQGALPPPPATQDDQFRGWGA
mmetsp:Transcript_12159/g.33163  ORF Transcript_12159/g.33163 Transcript_12159/m.33163 type:complete len:358 (-) Transcript_12159:135-1208(-)